MTKPETLRQKKVGAQIQKDVSDIFTRDAPELVFGALVSVTKVRMSPDLALAKIYVSVFPFAKSQQMLARLKAGATTVRHHLGAKVRNQLRIVPEVAFFVDDSIEYVEHIDTLLSGSGGSGHTDF